MDRKIRTGFSGGRITTVSRGMILTDDNKLVPHMFIDDANEHDAPYVNEALVTAWIEKNLQPSKYVLEYYTSYTLKHILERDLGIYMTNNQMKCFLRDCGFYPVDAKVTNWKYRITPKSPAFIIDEVNRVGRETYKHVHRKDPGIPLTEKERRERNMQDKKETDADLY